MVRNTFTVQPSDAGTDLAQNESADDGTHDHDQLMLTLVVTASQRQHPAQRYHPVQRQHPAQR